MNADTLPATVVEDGGAALPRPDGPAPPPDRIGRFLVLGSLGEGGMGSVFRAYDPTLERQVAIKLMHRGARSGHEQRMLREAQALARLSHPNVVQVYEVGSVDEQLFIAMELISGQTLDRWRRRRPTWRECLEVYRQAGRGLAAAHEAGMVHRDFKPSNCILDEQGRVRVLDFGLARAEQELPASSRGTTDPKDVGSASHAASAGSREPRVEADRDDPRGANEWLTESMKSASHSALLQRITKTGAVMGTVAYMSPEHVDGRMLDARSDQFSFCVSLYEALFGERPFADSPMWARLQMALGRPVALPTPPAGRRVPRWLVRALLRGLSARPDDRWPSMTALLDELSRRRRRTWVWWGSWAIVAAAVSWVLLGAPPSEPSCEAAAESVVAAWNDERRARVESAIVATELPYAGQTWSRVEPRLDGYAQQLAEAELAACRATDDARDSYRRCLGGRVADLRRAVSLLEEADVDVVERAVELVAQLPDIEECLAAELFEGRPQQERVDALRERLAMARAKARVGKPSEGLHEVGPVVREIDALGDPGLLAEARLAEGFVLLQNDRLDEAQQCLQQAFEGALGQGTGKVALEAATSLTYLVGVKKAQSEAGLWLAATARGLAERHDPRGLLEAEALTVTAQVLAERGQHAEAQARYEDALGILSLRVGADDLALVVALNGLGQVLDKQRRFGAAQERYERALAIRIAALGDRHPKVAYQRISLGNLLVERSELGAADAQYMQALEILTGLPEQRETLAQLHTNLGVLWGRQGRGVEGEHQLRRALEHWEALYGIDHPWVAKGRLSLGNNLRRRGLLDPAAEQYEQALEILESGEPTPANDDLLFRALRGLGGARAAQGRAAEAESYLHRGLLILERRGQARSIVAVRVYDMLGALHVADGKFEQAVLDHRTALTLLEGLPESSPGRLATTLFDLARAQYAVGQPQDALDHVERALELGRANPGEPGLGPEQITAYERLRSELIGARERVRPVQLPAPR